MYPRRLGLRFTEAGTIPDTKHDERREAAIEALCKVIDASRDCADVPDVAEQSPHGIRETLSSVKLVLIPVGTYAIGAHFPDSDTDCIIVGNIGPTNFCWAIVQENVSRQMNEATMAHDLILVILKQTIKDTVVQMMTVRVGDFRIRMQYCLAIDLAENWSRLKYSMESDITLPDASHRVLHTYRDQIQFHNPIRPFGMLQLAFRLVKLFCIRRGIHAPHFGFLGDVHLTIMVRRVAERLPSSAGAFELIKEFFQEYSSFDWASEIVSVSDVGMSYRRSAQEPMVTLSPQSRATNVASNASFLTRHTIISELCLGYESLVAEIPFPDIWRSEASSIAVFLDAYDRFIKIDVNYWGPSCMNARALIGYIESRIPRLLLNFHAADQQAIIRLWPDRLADSCQTTTSGGTSSIFGFYLLGLGLQRNEVSARHLIGVLNAFEDSVRTDESSFDASSTFFAVSICSHTELLSYRNIEVDRPIWRDDGIDEPLNTEEVFEAGRSAAPRPMEVANDRDRQEYVVNQLAFKKQRELASDLRPPFHVSSERLRTSADVYNRLLWDPDYHADDYLIGYEDRFLGIKEIPLTSWCREVDEETFIPFHRIVHFHSKSSGQVMWDRRAKIDRVFRSGQIGQIVT